MSLKDVPVRARLWAPDRSLPRFFGRLLLFLSDSTLRLLPSTFGRRKRAEVSLKRAVLHPRATKMYESVAQACRAAPSGDEKVRKCCPSVSCCTLGRRRSTKVSLKRAVLYPRATKKCESVAQACRAAPSGDEDVRKCCPREPCCTLGRRRCTKVLPKRVVLHHRETETRGGVAQACRAAPSGDEKVRKCCPREPCCTLGRRKCAKLLQIGRAHV